MKELDLAVNINIGSEDALVALVSRITNADAVKKELIAGSLAASLINCTHILDSRQLQLAIFKARIAQTREKMTTRNVYSEILYNLSPNRQITQAFKLFGIQDTDTACLVITVGDSKESNMHQVVSLLESGGAVCLPFEDISQFNSLESIEKLYKIQEEELKVGTLSEAVVSRIAAKEIIA
ncbi:TPRKB [Bugula neritina]|uniref:TPRKB n=1 Tax=Bugula neritina TaxID=10212 RepID=A0A7J7JA40_BUGNE|nr:TPRKB [Bugula neritina]